VEIPILIIGGGIGGMAAGLALAQSGFPVHVVEQAAEFSEIGAGLQLAPNALRILEELGVRPAVDALAVQPRNLVFMHADTGKHLTTVEFGATFRVRYGQPYAVMHRGDLLDVLLAACRAHEAVTLENNKRVTDLQDHATFAEVSFADGLWSRTRALLADDRPRADTYVAYRGAIPVSEIASPIEADDEIIWIGAHKHLVQYPIRRGELYNQVAVFRSAAYSPEIELTDTWGGPAELDEAFAGAYEQVRSSIGLINRERRWVMYDRPPLTNWTMGRITLLGDAAHPMVQYLAQGACQAIEDAGCLARSVTKSGGDVDEAFAAYQAERIPRTTLVQQVARGWGEVWHDDAGVISALRDRLFARRATDDYTDFDWLYGSRG
jgi:2-polyprenyl-6-methoxyphenol hydroxylase-like FAD-dependent oxidoreductase